MVTSSDHSGMTNSEVEQQKGDFSKANRKLKKSEIDTLLSELEEFYTKLKKSQDELEEQKMSNHIERFEKELSTIKTSFDKKYSEIKPML